MAHILSVSELWLIVAWNNLKNKIFVNSNNNCEGVFFPSDNEKWFISPILILTIKNGNNWVNFFLII